MNKQVIIFGAGISGLTVAHEMIKKNFDVIIIEKDTNVGGMAKTRWEDSGVPSEHSWRGFGQFYSNTFRIMKEIPYKKDKTTYDNLTKKVDFYILKDTEYKYKRDFTFSDKIVLFNDGMSYLLSDKRRKDFYNIKAVDYYKDKLSPDGYEFLIEFVLGPGYGMEKKDASVGHLIHFNILTLSRPSKYNHEHELDGQIYFNKGQDNWHLLNQPTNDGWLNPWRDYLIQQGVKFMFNEELIELTKNDDEIIYATVKNTINNNITQIKGTDYVLAITPHNSENILKNIDYEVYNNIKMLNEHTTSNQISFRIGLDKKIEYPTNYIGIVLSDSEYNITFYPQEKHFKNYEKMNIPYKTLWSGTLMDSISPGSLYNKPSISLTKEQLSNEIINQIIKSESLQKMIQEINGFTLSFDDIKYIEIWYEWKYDNNEEVLKQDYKKFVNNIYNEQYRPDTLTNIKNLYITGAHIKTSILIYSMEGAVESGLITSNEILKKYELPKSEITIHNNPILLSFFQQIDNILYNLRLPNIMYIIIFSLVFYLLYVYVV